MCCAPGRPASPGRDTYGPCAGPRPNPAADAVHHRAGHALRGSGRPEPAADVVPVHRYVVGKCDLQCAVETNVFMRPRHGGLTDPVKVQVLATDHKDRNATDFHNDCPSDVIARSWKLNRDRQIVSCPVPAALSEPNSRESLEIAWRGSRAEVYAGR